MEYDVAIVGAGAAGIATARRLAASRRSVILIEASERPGGRAWTLELDGLIRHPDIPRRPLLRSLAKAPLSREHWPCRPSKACHDGPARRESPQSGGSLPLYNSSC